MFMNNNYYQKMKNIQGLTLFVDISLFLLASWSEVGYSFFTQSAVSESIFDPLEKYLYSSISENSVKNVNKFLSILSESLSYADATLTIATIFDVKEKREKSYKEMVKGLQNLNCDKINIMLFLFNLVVFLYSFLIISLSPWTGLNEKNFNKNFVLLAGITMLVGQMVILLLQYSNYMFSTPKDISDFFSLSQNEKKNIIYNIFCTKKGLALALRSIANILTMGLRFHGISLFTIRYLFEDNQFNMVYSILAPISVVYRVLLTQSLNDYRKTFNQQTLASEKVRPMEEINQDNDVEIRQDTPINSKNNIEKLLTPFLALLISMVFLLRTFSTPVLYTGPISDPQKNYSAIDLVLACFGLLMGGFAASQYCKFMWGLGKEALKNTSAYLSDYKFFVMRCNTMPDREIATTVNSPLI